MAKLYLIKSVKEILRCFFLIVFVLSVNKGVSQENKKERNTVLSKEQVAKVEQILSAYNAASLTAEDALKINESFRNAGIKNGPELLKAIKEAGFDPEEIGRLAPKPGKRNNKREPNDRKNNNSGKSKENVKKYSIGQAISDRAQLHTIAFDALAFMTGDICGDSFLPPGKVSDFFGFQYLRDTDQGELGHNTSFVPKSANNVLYILSDEQVKQLITLAERQEKTIQQFAYKRFPLIKAFRRLQKKDLPPGKTKLSLSEIKKYSAELYQIDGLLSYQRAEVLGTIIRSFTNEQKTYLDKMKTGNSLKWPEKKDQLDKRKYSHEIHVAIMTYSSELFSWYSGSAEADTYFCPERHGMYFGSFYMKDIPAMGNKDYSISTKLTGNQGENFLNVLNEKQRNKITSLVEVQKNALQEIVEVRKKIATELRKFMTQKKIDKGLVLKLAERYGELDGEISYHYAVNFSDVSNSLTKNQLSEMHKLRNLKDFPCNGMYLYSKNIRTPEIINTDFFFE